MTTLDDNINIFSEYRLEEGELTLFEPCFCITLFSTEAVTKEHAPESLLTPYHIFWEDFGNLVDRILYDGNQSHGVKITERNRTVPYEWLRNGRNRAKDNTVIDLYSGINKRECRLPRLNWEYYNAIPEITRPSNSYFRVSLPLTWLAERNIEELNAYIARLAGDFPLSWGYAGFAFCFDSGELLGRKDLESYLKLWIERHPGIMSSDPRVESWWGATTDGITSLGWLTLLGSEFCSRMGGVTKLQQKMSSIPDVHVTQFMQVGALIRIGETPLLGDTLHNNQLDSYHAVAQVLNPLHQVAKRLATDYLHVTGIDDKEARKKWFNRFFDSKDEK